MWVWIGLLCILIGSTGYVIANWKAYIHKPRHSGTFQYGMKTFWAPNAGVLTPSQKEL